MAWEKEIKGKKWIMRLPCDEEQIWTFEMIKEYQASEYKWKVIEWGDNYDKCGIEFHKSGFTFNIKGEGLLEWDNTPRDSNKPVAYIVSRRELDKWLNKKGIVKPEFGAATYVYLDDGKLLK